MSTTTGVVVTQQHLSRMIESFLTWTDHLLEYPSLINYFKMLESKIMIYTTMKNTSEQGDLLVIKQVYLTAHGAVQYMEKILKDQQMITINNLLLNDSSQMKKQLDDQMIHELYQLISKETKTLIDDIIEENMKHLHLVYL